MGYNITKFCLRKPVTAFLMMIAVVFFGVISIISFKYELMPSIEMPVYAVATVYPGAQPEDIDSLITKKLEDRMYNLKGMKNLQGTSRENMSILAVQYNYGQNMDKAYSDLKKAVDLVQTDFPDSAQDPMIFEMDMNAVPVMKVAVQHKTSSDVYNYVEDIVVKELEKISEVSEVNISGGSKSYIRIAIKPEMMTRYNLSMDTLKAIILNADFSYPGGNINVGDRELSFTSTVEYETVESLKTIPIITGNKRTLYLEDIADVYSTKEKKSQVGRYDGDDCIVISITKNQSASTTSLSGHVRSTLDKLQKNDKNLVFTVVEDNADNITNSIKNVFETMIIAIILSMIVLFIFLGDIKASLIIGTSIPFSILTSFSCMMVCGYTLNIVTLSALVLGVGMMVDNSIVVLEACFRASDEFKGKNTLYHYCRASLNSARTIGSSVFGSTLTTVVVFAPVGFLQGMSGQFFSSLGFTIVFCMLASYVSAISIVPLLYVVMKPKEKTESLGGHIVDSLQELYRKTLPGFLKVKWLILLLSIAFVIGSCALGLTLDTALVVPTDNGMIKISVTTKPGLSYEAKDEIYKEFEAFVSSKPEVEHYVLSNSASSTSMQGGSGGQSLIAYLVDSSERKQTTKQIVREWKKELANVTDCTINIDSYSTSALSSFTMPSRDKCEFILQGTEYKKIKEANDRIVKQLEQRKDCSDITSTLDNAAPVIQAQIDPILAAAEGFTPAAVGGLLNQMLSGIEVTERTIDGEVQTIRLEFDDKEYDTIEKVANIKLTSATGNQTLLKDIAKIVYHDSPSGIPKYNKKYRCTITTYLNDYATENTRQEIEETIVKPTYSKYIEKATSTIDEMMNEEFSALAMAIIIAAFLVFIVMASQFESIKYSIMIMTTVLFSVAGGFIALWLADVTLSLTAVLGFLILIGTAVNNGILYVDTVNQFLNDGKELEWSLVEAGAIRLRPILMTTLTTIVSMIPMSCAYGKNGEVLQGLAVVDIGGLIVSTIMALLILPVYYYIYSGAKKLDSDKLQYVAMDAIIHSEDAERDHERENAERRANERRAQIKAQMEAEKNAQNK